MAGITVENTFAGATIETFDSYGTPVDRITLPSGKVIVNAAGWSFQQWDQQIQRTNDPADIDALASLKGSWDYLEKVYFDQYKQKVAEQAPPVTSVSSDPAAPVVTNTTQQNDANQAAGQGDDDSGSNSSTNTNEGTTDSTAAYDWYDAGSTDQNNTQYPANSGSTVAGSNGMSTPSGDGSKPGKRLQNPLGDFASYTYQISLYMITPDAYNAFIESGRKNINAIANAGSAAALSDYNNSPSGVYLIAQSGGINNANSSRAPGFDLDFYIDNLEIEAAISGGKSNTGSGGSTNEVNMKFQIIEPYGFSLITKLKNAADVLQGYSALLKKVPPEKLPAADRQNFILGIRFLGYDIQGNVISGLERLSGTTQVSATTTGPGSFETFYDITIKDLQFKLDGRATTYNISAVSTPTQLGMGLKCGRLTSDTTIVGESVEEALQNLVDQLNAQAEDSEVDIPNEYEIVYVGEDADLIRDASIVSKADTDKSKLPMLMEVITNKNITVKDEITATADVNKRAITFKGSGGATSIVQVIQQVVTQSSYIQDALKYLYTTDTTPDPATDSYDEVTTNSKKILKWINVSTEVINLGFDTTKNDFSYKIVYVVQTYDTPIVTALSAGLTTPYYGPHKRYEYWLTGKNSEITKFDMMFNQLYLNVAVKGLSGGENKSLPIPTAVGMRADAPRQGKLGIGAEAQNAYVNYLTDPGAYTEAHVTILGDPDFLVQDNSPSLNAVYNKFYGSTGYNVSGNGGQVFIEIDFKEAVDYDTYQGFMEVNNKLMFVDYPDEVKKYIKGISFQVTDVKSTFKGGKFEQTLTLLPNTYAKSKSKDTSPEQRENQSDAETARLSRQAQGGGATSQDNPKGTKSVGFAKAEPVVVSESVSTSSDTTSNPNGDPAFASWNEYEGQVTSPTGGPSVTAGILAKSASKPIQDDDSIAISLSNTVIKPAEISIPESEVRAESSTGLKIFTG